MKRPEVGDFTETSQRLEELEALHVAHDDYTATALNILERQMHLIDHDWQAERDAMQDQIDRLQYDSDKLLIAGLGLAVSLVALGVKVFFL